MLCFSTGSLPDAFTFSRIAETLAGTPFPGVELVLTAPMLALSPDAGRSAFEAYWQGIRRHFGEKSLCFRNVHLGSPYLLGGEAHRPGLASLHAQGRARKFEAVLTAMAIAKALDCPNVTLTTGLPEAGAGPGEQLGVLADMLDSLVRKLPAGQALLIEQEPEHVVHSVSQLAALCRKFPGQVFANFDVGHSHVLGEDIAAGILELGPRLRNVHLEDIAGRVHAHKLYGDGDIDFAPLFAALAAIGYRGDYTPDLYPFKEEYPRALAESAAFLRKHGVLA